MNHLSILLRLLFTSFLVLANMAYAGSNQVWTDVATTSKKSSANFALLPNQYRLLKWDAVKVLEGLDNPLSVLSRRALSLDASNSASLEPLTIPLRIPLPDGSFLTVNMLESDVMAPGLAAKYPQIKTYRVDSADNDGIYGAIEFTEQGFHAMLFMHDGTRLFIDPRVSDQGSEAETFYISYYDTHYHPAGKKPINCNLPNHHYSHQQSPTASSLVLPITARKSAQRSGAQLKTFRLAMSATSEYTAVFGSKSAALSAMITTVSRVNVIYQRDLAVKLQLVENTDQLIQVNKSIFSNNNAAAMLTENQREIDRLIGSNNYDIGHVVSTGGGGLATLGSICNEGSKAEGVTGSPDPAGDAFDIDFVAHEIGHQLGATHTFNSETKNCGGANRESATAYEPGSGSTIMAYAGICGAKNNTQNRSDAMFHIISIVQIGDFIETGEGSVCGVTTALNNKQPVADAGNDFTIPANTPFELSGVGSDPDKDTLAYSWEQIDAGRASDIDVVEIDNAIFRAFLPTSDPVRIFPTLSTLLLNTPSKGETIPSLARELNFSFVVRDGKGGVAADEMKVMVSSSNAFRITSHHSSITLKGNTTSNLAWDVGSSNSAPVNCSQVDIQLSTNTDYSFITVLAKTPNDGFEAVLIPASVDASSTARFKVKCSDNIFFDISDADLTVESLMDISPLILANLGSNNVADPGESIQLTIPLQNNSSVSATSVRGTLSSKTSGAGAEITVANSHYANIQPSTQVSNTTAYELEIPTDHVCGVDLPLILSADYTLGSQTAAESTKHFNINIPTGTASAYSETNATVIKIPDNESLGISSQVTVAGIGQMNKPDINIDIDIDHEYRGDVVISLTSPQGTSVQLKELFIDEGADVKGNFPRTLSPTASLSAFDGENMDGIWILKVSDNNEADGGTLNSWTLNLTNFICEVPESPLVEVINVAPVVRDDSAETDQGEQITIDVLNNDSDIDNDTLTLVKTNNLTNGTATITNNQIIYTPQEGFSGVDKFSYTLSDGNGHLVSAVVTVLVKSVSPPIPQTVNTTPVAIDSILLVAQGGSANGRFNASDADNDALTYRIVSNGSQGMVRLDNAATGVYTYTPDQGKSGQDSFTFRANDGTDDSNLATISITINAVVSEPDNVPVNIPVNNLGNSPSQNDPSSNPNPVLSNSAATSSSGGGSFSLVLLIWLLLMTGLREIHKIRKSCRELELSSETHV